MGDSCGCFDFFFFSKNDIFDIIRFSLIVIVRMKEKENPIDSFQ